MRWLTVAGVFAVFLLSLSAPVHAQPEDEVGLLSRLEQLMGTLPDTVQLEIGGEGDPASWSDQLGDLEHPSGDDPGYQPEFIDIDSVAAIRLGSGWEPLFGSTDDAAGPWSLGQGLVDTDDGVIQTYAGDDMVRDGSQYRLGAYFFGLRLAGAPPASVPGRCEFVIWIHEIRNPATWEPVLSQDPATGTNLAFGIGLNPEVESGAFVLELSDESGVFEPSFEFDVRGFFADDFVGIFVPGFAAAEFDAINVSTFCAETGFLFEADASGADQLGLVELTPDDLGVYTGLVPPSPTVTTAPPDSVAVDTTTTSAEIEDTVGLPAGLVLIGVTVLVLALLVVAWRSRTPR